MKNIARLSLGSIFGLSFLALSISSFAAAPTAKYSAPSAEDAGFDASAMSATASEVKATRKLADAERTYSESDLTPGFKVWRDKFLKATTADQLDALLVEADSYYDTLSPDVQYFLAQAELVRPFRSIVYRLRPLFEHDKSIQSSAVSILRSLASSLRIYLPTDQWEAGFAYVTLPSVGHDDTNVQFHTVQEFQDFLMSTTPNFTKQSKRVATIYKARKAAGDNSALVWDNQLFYIGGFADGIDRYRVNGNAEIAAFLSGVYGTLQSIESFCAYNQDQLLDVAQDLGHLAGMNGFTFLQKLEGEDIGVSAKDRTGVLKKGKYKNFMTLKGPKATSNSDDSGAILMAKAFGNLVASVHCANVSWDLLQGAQSNSYAFLNPIQVKGSQREGDARFKNMNAMLKAKTTIRSVVGGEVADIDLPNFFLKNPPQDLKDFLPTDFDNSAESVKMTTTSGAKLSYHNYFRGRATGWDADTWKVLAPSVSNPEDVATVLRVLKQSWGGDFVSPILDFVAR